MQIESLMQLMKKIGFPNQIYFLAKNYLNTFAHIIMNGIISSLHKGICIKDSLLFLLIFLAPVACLIRNETTTQESYEVECKYELQV